MIKIIGDGGHAKVVRDVIRLMRAENTTGYCVAIGDNAARKKEAESLGAERFPVLIHPRAIVSDSAVIGDGSVVMAGALIGVGATVGRHCIINSGAILEHHATAHDFSHLAPGAVVCGGSVIGQGAFIGANGTVVQYVRVPEWYLVKAGDTFFYNTARGPEGFWVKADKTESCWLWQALKNKTGYGVVNYNYKTQLAHRVAWTLTHGDIPAGLYVCHKCDTPGCINPDHLFLGTQLENMRDMASKGRSRRGKRYPRKAK